MLAKNMNYKNGDLVSYEEFQEISKNFIGKIEYIDGRLYMFAGGLAPHSLTKNNLAKSLMLRVKEPCKVMIEDAWYYSNIDKNAHVIPDVMICCDYIDSIDNNKYKGNPKVIIEIASKSTVKDDQNKKKELYKNLGVEEYIIIYPEYEYIDVFELQKHEFITSYSLSNDFDYVFKSKVNNDVEFSLKEIFCQVNNN